MLMGTLCFSISPVAVASESGETIQKEIGQLSYSAFVQDSVFWQNGDGFNESGYHCSGTSCHYVYVPPPPPPPVTREDDSCPQFIWVCGIDNPDSPISEWNASCTKDYGWTWVHDKYKNFDCVAGIWFNTDTWLY